MTLNLQIKIYYTLILDAFGSIDHTRLLAIIFDLNYLQDVVNLI